MYISSSGAYGYGLNKIKSGVYLQYKTICLISYIVCVREVML